MKTFESLFAELSEKAAAKQAGSLTVDELGKGTHFIGKKIVEEAGETWIAAEYEGADRTAEEMSQLIYHLQVMMIDRDIYKNLFVFGRAIGGVAFLGGKMLRIAVPNKGMLSEPAWNMLAEAGYRLRSNPRQLVVEDPDNDVELFYLRPLDIAIYVGRQRNDVGITGHDLLLNSGTDAKEHMELGFGASTFRFAAPNDSPISKLEDIEGKRVATSFDKLVHDYLAEHGINAETVHLDGAVESSVHLVVADLIADVVSTGTTLRNAGLRIFAEPLLHSEAVLIRSPRLAEDDDRLTILSRRLQGVLTAQRYVLMDYDIPVEKVSAAVDITPGFESPTVSPLHDKQWAAVRVVVPKAKVNQLMDQLYEVGARGIIVTALQASRM